MQELKLPNGVPFYYSHAGECAFLYDEIFKRECYSKHGIKIPNATSGCVFDVGANIGMSALFFHKQNPGIKIHCFEPSPKTYEVLTANIVRLGINARLHKCALSNESGTMMLTHYPNKSTMSGLFANPVDDKLTSRTFMVNEGADGEDADFLLENAFAAESVPCEVRTISDIIDNDLIQDIDLLKVDVEKSELNVLLGIRPEHWRLVRQLVVEVHDIEGRLERIRLMLEQQGYKITIEQDPLLKDTLLYDVYAVRHS
jgi:31-O-methyltransferase